MNKFDSIVAGALDLAQAEVLKRKNSELWPEHLLFGLISHPSSYLSRVFKKYKKDITLELDKIPSVTNQMALDQVRASARFSEWLTYASSHAIQSQRDEISEKDLVKFLPQVFKNLDLDYALLSLDSDEEEHEVPSFLVNLNELAMQGKLDPVIGRTKEIRAVMEILGRRSKNNPVLVGPAGVGKTAIVEGLAEAIVKGNVPDVLEGKVVYTLDMGSLMAGTKFRGEFEERLQNLLKFLKAKAQESILFIDEMHQLVGAGKTDGAMDAANLLKPALARGELNCIGATTYDEYQKFILGDSALDRRFRPVPVNEPSKEDSIEILMGLKEKLEIHHGIKIGEDAIYNAVVLSDQYITDKNLPDKAIDLVDEAASALKLSAEAMPSKLVELQSEIRQKKIYAQVGKLKESELKDIEVLEADFNSEKEKWEKEVYALKRVSDVKNQLDKYRFELEQAERKGEFDKAGELKYSVIPELEKELNECSHDWVLNKVNIAQVISRQQGIPVEKILKSKQENILRLGEFLTERVFGQDEALNEIHETLISAHAGLTDPTRPLGSFLLKGPSGVGKTETAKALTQFLFDSEANLLRFDLSEYSQKHDVAKLIGAPAGYIGHDDGGILTEAVRRKPYSVILFDEIEKAHFDFSDILLQILDDGRLTDNKGRTIDFKNTIILLTTNSKNIEHDFKPEVLGRLDAVLDYHELDESIMESLVLKQVKLLNERLSSKEVSIELDECSLKEIALKGHDPRFGARPLQSVFNKLVTRPLSKLILKDELKSGKYTLSWSKKDQSISIR
ncbi:AAA family ATPase [Halobacteriovorax sp. GB3]|uniref:ATP-dependent Clp protease ATP-binding subunit n=1 Tax=Halobacteriovorax sp. GB3 TaxID=2719615 RepID=UPI002360AB9D|nr:AAA family ATPase [Halobacteriovorax sp. GB3]MDD0853081.1 AAA family ATPase [Halobacteriovorax sp. GB3]